jgi:nitrogen-specific signal transduction histidine kinase
MEKEFFETEKLSNSSAFFLNEEGTKPPEIKEKSLPNEQSPPFLSSFLVELVHCVKNTLATIKNFTLLSMEKYDDVEFRKYAYRSVTGDIKKIDSVLNSLLNYININTPIIKSNTLHLILEVILEANQKQLQDKKINIIKNFEKDLPEICIHDEQIKFIFDSVLQYAILSTPTHGTIGFLIKTLDVPKRTAAPKTPLERKDGSILVVVGFVDGKKQIEQVETLPGIAAIPKEEAMDLILELVKEIVQKNRGTMTMKVDEKKSKTLIILRLPIERRKSFYYEPITI